MSPTASRLRGGQDAFLSLFAKIQRLCPGGETGKRRGLDIERRCGKPPDATGVKFGETSARKVVAIPS